MDEREPTTPRDAAQPRTSTRRYQDLDAGQGKAVNFRPERYSRAQLGPIAAVVAVEVDDMVSVCRLHDVSQSGVAYLRRGGDPNVLALFTWHFAEEIEHKATCFDLYERLGGKRRTRLRASRRAWLLILAITFHNLFDMLREDGRLFDLRDHAKGLWYLFGPRGLITKMLPGLLAYFDANFHPWQDAADARAIAGWLELSAGYITNAGSRT
jgi:predicted metal-dependent hydrolase